MKLNPDDKIETIEVILTEDKYPIAYKNKLDELMEQKAFPSRKEAIRWLSKTPIVLELYYEKHSGLFAVESGALEANPESIRSPYSGEPFTEEEEQDEATMNGIQLLSALRKLDRNKKNALKETEKTYAQKENYLLDAWAKKHARFKPGDIIVSKDGNDYNCHQGTRIRIKTVQTNYQTLDRGERLHVVYWGQLLLPDLTESTTWTDYLINDYGDNEITLITRPEFDSFVVTDEPGNQEFPAKTYREALDKVKYVCTQLEQNAETYGITPEGERVLLLKTPTLAKYFKNK